jgi:hypothetical protein
MKKVVPSKILFFAVSSNTVPGKIFYIPSKIWMNLGSFMGRKDGLDGS